MGGGLICRDPVEPPEPSDAEEVTLTADVSAAEEEPPKKPARRSTRKTQEK